MLDTVVAILQHDANEFWNYKHKGRVVYVYNFKQDECLTQTVKEKPQLFVVHVEIGQKNI